MLGNRQYLKLAVVLLVTSHTPACYVYQDVERGALGPGESIRAHFANEPARAGVTGFELSSTVPVSGRVVTWDEHRLVMVRDRGDPVARQAFVAVSDTIGADWAAIASLERKEFSHARTGAVVLGVAVVAGVAIKALFGEWAGGRNLPRTEGPETLRSPFP